MIKFNIRGPARELLTWLRDAGRAAMASANNRWRQERDHSKTPLLIFGAGTVIVMISWTAVLIQPSVQVVIIAGIIVPIALLWLGLRLARGTMERAEETERRKFDRFSPVPRKSLPTRIQRKLETDEIVLGCFRKHPISLLVFPNPKPVAIGLGAWLLGLLVAVISGNWILVAALVLAFSGATSIWVWLWWREVLYITQRNLLRVMGLIAIKTDLMPRARVTDVQMFMSVVSRTLAYNRLIWVPYGIIHVESAGQNQALSTLYYVPYVERVWLLMKRQFSDEELAEQSAGVHE